MTSPGVDRCSGFRLKVLNVFVPVNVLFYIREFWILLQILEGLSESSRVCQKLVNSMIFNLDRKSFETIKV